ncbi:MAG: trehalase family glycosidase [archaeon]
MKRIANYHQVMRVIFFLLSISIYCIGGEKAILSNLNATKNSALFTTYAAAMERSEFTLDEGYHFLFYDSTRGVDFTTDTGGNLCLAFKNGADYIYESRDFYSQPVVTASYPDMVKYNYAPFQNLEVEATFIVHSSHIAFQELLLKNTGNRDLDFQIIPFMQNKSHVFNDVQFQPDDNAITFSHEELPDSWVLSHDVPYINPINDVFLLSRKADRMTSYRSYCWGDVEIPQEIDLEKKPVCVVRGRMSHQDGALCDHLNPKPQIMVMLNDDPSRILTATAPRWGSNDASITSIGYYGIELGNFDDLKNGDICTISLLCRETGEFVSVRDNVRIPSDGNSVRYDVTFKTATLYETPVDIDKDIWGSGTEIRLFWKHNDPNAKFHVYRRDYRKNGYYERIAENLTQRFFTDKNIQDDEVYGYVVTAVAPDGGMSMPTTEINNIAGSDFLTDIRYPDQLKNDVRDFCRVIAMPTHIHLKSGETEQLRIVRAVARPDIPKQELIRQAKEVLTIEPDRYLAVNEELFRQVPKVKFDNPDHELLYWSAFNLMRQVMLPPENKCNYNYYVFSREPQWGWGHGGQVFHESLTMLAYALMDPVSAMNSQRVYRERQYESGYINYRTGPFLDEIIEYNGELTSSAPWYAWQNWEIYKITKDQTFLKEMYRSSEKFYNYYVSNRDKDGDGLCEWGAHAVLECVRDGLVAVWDEVGWPSNFEGLDVNCMLVKEANALADMAKELGYKIEAEKWRKDAQSRGQKINATMWDEATGFYYNVDMTDHDFTFKKENDLKREEIIGFLPLWAGIASKEQAAKLVQKLTDPNKFWRKYGVPSLAADDSYYNSKGYWNGPVWVEWDFLVEDGLLKYGFIKEAKEMVLRVATNMTEQLKKDHQFWEFYSPDDQWAGYHRQYIWAGIINRMLNDVLVLKK